MKLDEDENKISVWINQGQWDECVAVGSLAVEPLISKLKSLSADRDNADSRYRIIYALGKIGDRRAVDAIIPCLDDYSEPPGSNEGYRVSSVAADILGLIGDTRAVEPLLIRLSKLRRANNKVFWEQRCRIINALGELGDPIALSELNADVMDEHEWVRDCARKNIKKIKKNMPPSWHVQLYQKFKNFFNI